MSNIGNITQQHRQRVAWIVEAASKKDGLALLEVTCNEDGSPAVLLVAVDRDEDGKGGRMAPLARMDVDFENDFTPQEGVETVVTPPEPEMETRITPVDLEIQNTIDEDLEKVRRATEVDNAGEGC